MNLLRKFPIAFIACLTLATFCFSVENTGGHSGLVRTLSAQTMGKTKLNIGASATMAQATDYVSNVHFSDTSFTQAQDPSTLLSSNVYMALGIVDFWDVGVSLPFYYDWAGFREVRDGGLGDLEVSTKFMIPPFTYKKLFYQAIYLGATVPTGMPGSGLFPRHPHLELGKDTNAASFYTTKYVAIKPMLLLSCNLGNIAPVEFHINFGGTLTEANKQNTVVGAIGLEYTPTEFFCLFTEMWGESRFGNLNKGAGYDVRRDPLFLTPGIRITAHNGLYLHFAADFSLSSKNPADNNVWRNKGFTYSTGIIPDYGIHFELGWNGFLTVQDADKDGIPDNADRCPNDAEDIDGFEDSDGCPDPDNDKDGICDPWVSEQGKQGKYNLQCKGTDKCPDQPEDFDGFQDDDGCPDYDNDGDGIIDSKDQCPNIREDFDGFEDNDGCPDYDNDKDGVPDSLDRCPNLPEDVDGFEDSDGCPDPDNDKDGILDVRDKCPNQPETYNGYLDEDGCPDTLVKVKKEPDFPKFQILRNISFVNTTAEITFDSFQWLSPIVRAMKEYPEIEIEIRGHSDSMGNFSKNMQMSQMRAEAVRQYLVNQGVESGRIRAVGYGPGSPIADNRTASGRALNRRIEVARIK